jgi:glyoxylase-like metal-dependent hydrolase (beta-lactamase superfamily II)
LDTFAILTDRYIILIDTMISPETMQQAVEMLRRDWSAAWHSRQLLVINTHGDWDHVWGNSLFVGPDCPLPAPIVGQRRTAEVMSSAESADLLASFQSENPDEYRNAGFVPPTLQFAETFLIDGGDLTLHLFPTPGHTPDHTAIWVPEIRLLMVGDAAEFPVPFVHDGPSLPIIRDSLHRLLAHRPDHVLHCHARGISNASVIELNIAYFDELERRCRTSVTRSGPPNLDETDIVDYVGWTLQQALPAGVWERVEQREFYERAHQGNLKAGVEWVMSIGSDPAL